MARHVAAIASCVTAAATTLRGCLDDLFPKVVELEERKLAEAQTPWRPDPPGAYCLRCGATAGPAAADATGCAFCRGERVPWDRVVRLGGYTAPLDERIRAMKFARQWQWAPWLGERLAEAVAPLPLADPVVCPVPMHWFRRWRRGFNQAALIGEALARHRGWRFAPVLRRTRHTPPQTAVAPSDRSANVRNSFAVAEVDLRGCHVVLVDDVKTSGSTLSACTRLLRDRGAASVTIAVAAVADPKGTGFRRI